MDHKIGLAYEIRYMFAEFMHLSQPRQGVF